MSCFQLSPYHIAAVLGSAKAIVGHPTDSLALEFAQRFAAMNAKACNDRYPEEQPTEPVAVAPQMIKAWVEAPLSIADLHVAMRSLAYQCSDAYSWEKSAEGAFLCLLKAVLPVSAGRGNSDCWEISGPSA